LQPTKYTFANWIKSWNNIATLSFSLARKIVKQGEPLVHG
jgi:hypoxanthine phosphoribosyltransferase